MNEDQARQQLEIQGHRGARGLLPENTLFGFAAALGLGVDTLELDVAISRDGVLMVHHDLTLNPATTRDSAGQWIPVTERPSIYSLSAAQLQTYDVGTLKPDTDYAKRYPHQQAVAGSRIPTLMQVIELLHSCRDTSVRLNIEAKLDPGNPALTAAPEIFAKSLVDILRATDMTNRATIQSFDWRVLAHVQALAAPIPTGYLSEQGPGKDTVKGLGNSPSPWTNGMHPGDYQGSLPRMVHAAGGAVWAPDFRNLTAQALDEAHTFGLRVAVWTVNSPDDILRMLELGVDSIISDYPDRVREAAHSRGLRVAEPAAMVP